MSDEMEPLSQCESDLIDGMRKLHLRGVEAVSPDLPEYAKVIFRDGFTIEKYNEVVPGLVEKGLVLVASTKQLNNRVYRDWFSAGATN